MGKHLLHYIYVTVYPKENLSKRDLGIFQIITTYDKFNGHHNAAEWYYDEAHCLLQQENLVDWLSSLWWVRISWHIPSQKNLHVKTWNPKVPLSLILLIILLFKVTVSRDIYPPFLWVKTTLARETNAKIVMELFRIWKNMQFVKFKKCD